MLVTLKRPKLGAFYKGCSVSDVSGNHREIWWKQKKYQKLKAIDLLPGLAAVKGHLYL